MSTPLRLLLASKFLENSQTTQVAAATTTRRIDDFIISNRTASPATLIINVVPNGGSVATSNELFPSRTLTAGEVVQIPPFLLGPGEFISTIAGTASALVAHIGGREFA